MSDLVIPGAMVGRLPPGLLNVLDIHSLGRGPQYASDVVGATYDWLELLLSDRWEVLTVAGTNAVGTANTLIPGMVVPAGELWYVHSFGLSTAALGAGVTFRLHGWFAPPQTTSSVFYGSESTTQTTGAGVRTSFPRPTWLPSGWQAGFTALTNVGGPVAVDATMLFVRFRR